MKSVPSNFPPQAWGGIKGEVEPMDTPRSLSYRMPGEWEQHAAIWLAWPHDRISFPNLEKVEQTFVQIISAIHSTEQVELLVRDKVMKVRVEEMLAAAGVDISKNNFHFFDYADVWTRDTAPTFVVKSTPFFISPLVGGRMRGGMRAIKWKYNAYGNKWPALLKDDNIGFFIAKALKTQILEPGIVMEGGSFDVNGAGSLLTTEQCLLNPNRNPKFSREQIENNLREYLGVRNIIWLKEGIAGDDTDGHVDDIARFVNQNIILAAYEDDEADENFSALKENYDILKSSKDEQGRPFNVIKLPMPKLTREDGSRLPASYANFYIGNGKVLVPTFGRKNDEKALQIIQKQFPDREVVDIDCRDMVHGFGAIHCATQQQPKV